VRQPPPAIHQSLRVPARNQSEARKRYLRFLKQAVSCVSRTAHLYVGEAPLNARYYAMESHPEWIRLRRSSGASLYLRLTQLVEPILDERFPGEHRVSTRAYHYAIARRPNDDATIVAWHWAPANRDHSYPHIHSAVEDLDGIRRDLHLPTGGRVSVEQVLLFAINELDVKPVRSDWKERLGDSQNRFDLYQVQDRSRRASS
jgi:hypothetical protein